VQQACVQGVSTRKVDELLQALELTGVDKSAVSRMCRELDTVVEQFRHRPMAASYPYRWLDALDRNVRQHHRIGSQAVVIAVGVRETGKWEVLSLRGGRRAAEGGVLDGVPAQPGGRAWAAPHNEFDIGEYLRMSTAPWP
jgi:transposase-like protein